MHDRYDARVSLRTERLQARMGSYRSEEHCTPDGDAALCAVSRYVEEYTEAKGEYMTETTLADFMGKLRIPAYQGKARVSPHTFQ